MGQWNLSEGGIEQTTEQWPKDNVQLSGGDCRVFAA